MKINILQVLFFGTPPRRSDEAWFALGQEFVKLGHEVNHISRLDHGLKNSDVINGVNHRRIRGANAVKNPYLLKLLEFPYVLRAIKAMQTADILVTHTFWAPFYFQIKSLVGFMFMSDATPRTVEAISESFTFSGSNRFHRRHLQTTNS